LGAADSIDDDYHLKLYSKISSFEILLADCEYEPSYDFGSLVLMPTPNLNSYNNYYNSIEIISLLGMD